MTQEKKEKLEKIVEGNHRKKGEPVNIQRLIKIADKLDRIEAQTRKEELVSPYASS